MKNPGQKGRPPRDPNHVAKCEMPWQVYYANQEEPEDRLVAGFREDEREKARLMVKRLNRIQVKHHGLRAPLYYVIGRDFPDGLIDLDEDRRGTHEEQDSLEEDSVNDLG